ncbi:nucleotide exchange factor GrpE [Noviherbaspirillum denitrificans]|uniref:Protein GrpE n=1 Tax=Noviherbaspirillum denitrificans TaxID=1968433 RepID=A0A254T755_9BURK|nr:nucleotide exchange factor GrpE [Noviherbaspirillum denitrificans]OWW18481.1 molecular chaperone GrpE [Noviherbaspirillum denitrificans]
MQNQNEVSNRETTAETLSQPDAAPQDGEHARTGKPSLEERLARAESSLAEMQDSFLRAKAEIENMRRRAQEDLANAHKYAIENFAQTLLPVKDSLEMALQVETPSVESLREGVDMTLKQLSSAFERNRLTEVNPKPGDRFDPDRHQAISMVPSTQPSNTVVNVLQKGYLIADRLLRPALVTVAQPTTGGNSS